VIPVNDNPYLLQPLADLVMDEDQETVVIILRFLHLNISISGYLQLRQRWDYMFYMDGFWDYKMQSFQ